VRGKGTSKVRLVKNACGSGKSVLGISLRSVAWGGGRVGVGGVGTLGGVEPCAAFS